MPESNLVIQTFIYQWLFYLMNSSEGPFQFSSLGQKCLHSHFDNIYAYLTLVN